MASLSLSNTLKYLISLGNGRQTLVQSASLLECESIKYAGNSS